MKVMTPMAEPTAVMAARQMLIDIARATTRAKKDMGFDDNAGAALIEDIEKILYGPFVKGDNGDGE